MTERGFMKPFSDRRFTNGAAVLDYFEEAMAAILLLYAALDAYANESLPEGFELDTDRDHLTREQLEGRGIELRLSRAVSAALGKPNLRLVEPGIWASVVRLKQLRDDIAHVKARHSYSSREAAATIFARLLVDEISVISGVVEAVQGHYGKAPRRVPGSETPD
jgi:hypothetical protein